MKPSSNQYFVGYFELARFFDIFRRLSDNTMMFGSLSRSEHGSSMPGLSVVSYSAQLQFIGVDGLCHYWRMNLGSQQMAHGKPLANKERVESIKARAESAWVLIESWLGDDDVFLVDGAQVSMPVGEGWSWVDGKFSLMRYDKESDRFVQGEGDPEPIPC